MRQRILTMTALGLFLAAAGTAVLRAQQPAPPTNRTVWDGVFTADQAARGRTQFAAHCVECHGGSLEGGEGPALVGDRFWNSWRESTVDALLTHVSKNMPLSDDGSAAGKLSAMTYADIVAYILSSNGFPAGQADLSAESVAGVHIIRREGPGDLPAGTLAHIVGCLEKGSGNDWVLTKATRPVRVRGAAAGAEVDREAALGDQQFALKFVLTRLDRYAGYRMAATGALIGEGGADGINVDTVTPVSPTCE
jgi:mono/diheme cytochrome c family protein